MDMACSLGGYYRACFYGHLLPSNLTSIGDIQLWTHCAIDFDILDLFVDHSFHVEMLSSHLVESSVDNCDEPLQWNFAVLIDPVGHYKYHMTDIVIGASFLYK